MDLKLDLPKIPMLQGEENLDEWKDMLRRHLRVHGLRQYIDQDVPEPLEEEDKLKWETRRAAVGLIMTSTLSKVRQTLINHGWDPEEENPKIVYDLVVRAIPKISEEAIGDLVRELGRIDRATFSTIQNYQNRIQFLKRRLGELDCCPPDKMMMWLTINGIKETHI